MASKRSALITTISAADFVAGDGPEIQRLWVERIFAPVPIGWKVRIHSRAGRRRLLTFSGAAIQRACAQNGWRIIDHVAGWSAVPPGPVAIGADAPIAAIVGELSAAFGRGEVAIVPTDTVYGLIAPMHGSDGQRQITNAKHRSSDRPSQVLINSSEQASTLARLSPQAQAVVERGWPGPLTVVVDRRGHADVDLGGDPSTIGLRWPDHDLCCALISELGPLIATSANQTGGRPVESADEAIALIRSDSLVDVGVVIDGGHVRGAASTVVDLRGEEPVVLREGALALSTIVEWWNSASADGANRSPQA